MSNLALIAAVGDVGCPSIIEMEEFAFEGGGMLKHQFFDPQLLQSIQSLFGYEHIDRATTPNKFFPNIRALLKNSNGLTPPSEIESPEDTN